MTDKQIMPWNLAVELYQAHQRGFTIEELAEKLGLPLDWTYEHVEAARLCMEYQVRVQQPSL